MKGKKKVIAWVALIALIVIQFIKIDKTNPEIVESADFYSQEQVPEDVKKLLVNACNDCHSHDIEYPWYTNIQPVAWWVKGHIKSGIRQLNFSEWGQLNRREKSYAIDECIEVLENKRMPLKSYTWMHSEAKLSQEDRQRLMAYFESIRKI